MNDRQPLLSRRNFAGLLALAPLFAAGGAAAAPASLRGSVSYRERIALPPGATVIVRLIDVSLADAPSQTIAETTIRPRGQVPVPFVLRYDDRDIRGRRSYALSAEIREGDRLLFTTTRRYSVLAGGRDDTDLVLERWRRLRAGRSRRLALRGAGWRRKSVAKGFAAAARQRWKFPARAAFPAMPAATASAAR